MVDTPEGYKESYSVLLLSQMVNEETMKTKDTHYMADGLRTVIEFTEDPHHDYEVVIKPKLKEGAASGEGEQPTTD